VVVMVVMVQVAPVGIHTLVAVVEVQLWTVPVLALTLAEVQFMVEEVEVVLLIQVQLDQVELLYLVVTVVLVLQVLP
jgi:hypothetical protein